MMIGIASVIALTETVQFKAATTVISLLCKALREDTSEVLKKKIADSELRTAQSVLDSLAFESEQNFQHGINRVITHMETAFTLYNDKEEFDSSCVCAIYLSVMHKAIGNSDDALHKSIWLRVPINSGDYVEFGKYGSHVKSFFSYSGYNELISVRREQRIKYIDEFLRKIRLSKYREKIPGYEYTGPELMFGLSVLRLGVNALTGETPMGEIVAALEAEKRNLQGVADTRSDFRKAIDRFFWF